MNSNNKSGVTGVCYDKQHNSWLATWNDAKGYQCMKIFGSNKHGNAEAKAMAIEYCHRMIRLLPHYVEALRLNVNEQ